jgi:molybdopterin molybdotransferase
MNTNPRPALQDLDSALARLLAQAHPLLSTESVDTFDADGRVLAEVIRSPLNVPGFDNSAMDGYALRCADVPAPGVVLPVSQRIPAGAAAAVLQAGTVARIFTGASLPAGADAVLMQEDAQVIENFAPPSLNAASNAVYIRVNAPTQPGQWVRRRGEDIALGAEVLTAGTRLTPAHLGLIASVGQAQVRVSAKPRVALFSTGDELVMPGQLAPADLPFGAIYNSNRFFLRALLQRLGCEVTDYGIVPDQRAATLAALQAAALQHDLILTSGGVSVGEEDHVKPAVQALGSLNLWSIAMKPGKPFAYGSIRRHGVATMSEPAAAVPIDARCETQSCAHFMGLPGNPVSSFVTFLLLVRPFLLRLQGIQHVTVPSTPLRATFDWPRPDKRREFLRAQRRADGTVQIFANQSSAVLTSTTWADGLIDNPGNQTIAQGDTVRFIAFSDLLT